MIILVADFFLLPQRHKRTKDKGQKDLARKNLSVLA